ncbi:pyridoxamine 5'-phosphate oxidase family protein [Candidatus Fermentibacterales bacterium]|nr:pyridoxamine 5'-phosphate oxidase family protein [Candidatus Fermentibacterales bacterium]
MSDGREMTPEDLRDTILGVLDRNRLAVLATQRDGQPHASLMAFTPLKGLELLAFATYRDTLKYQSLMMDGRVAVLIDDRSGEQHPDRRLVVTAPGEVAETGEQDRRDHLAAHLARHPDLRGFLESPECELVCVAVRAYQVVRGIEDVRWLTIAGD